MLLRHSALYLVARGLPGIINFLAIAVYTRLLPPAEFGRYALVVAGVGLAHVIIFQWLQLVLIRFVPTCRDDCRRLLGGLLVVFVALSLVAGGVGLGAAAFWPDPAWQRLLLLAVPLLLMQAWLEFNLAYASARLAPGDYGRLTGARAVVGLGVGATLAWVGLGASAPLLGLLLGACVAALLFGRSAWRGVRPQRLERQELRRYLAYGLPLTVTFALDWVVACADRVMLGWLLDVGAAGLYAVGYDLAQHSVGLLLCVIHIASYPLAVHALEQRGEAEAREQLRQNGELLLGVGWAAAAGLAVLAPLVATVLVGADYRVAAAMVIPWIALAAAVGGFKALYLDIAFHLGRNSRGLVISGGFAAVVNLGLNLALIPPFGIIGAAWATVLSLFCGALISLILGRRVFQLPPLASLLGKGATMAAATALGAGAGLFFPGIAGLAVGLSFGGGAAALTAWLLDLAGVRQHIKAYYKRGDGLWG